MFRAMLDRFVFVYLDDPIFSWNKNIHVQHVPQVVQSFLDHQLFFKAERCMLHVSTVSFLDFVVSTKNIQMKHCKVSAVAEWPVPTSRKEMQRFLGFANFYQQFLRNFAVRLLPLYMH